ncbi:acrosin-like, partial [Neopsephotus bourkii]|uniref:acrosin-like n=1 Tax=Neopsephotus bourkii TaxID=309878 RepID=UPI002AA5C524
GPPKLSELGPEVQVHTVKQVIAHELYTNISEGNDIALLELDQPVQCSDYVQLACVSSASLAVSQLTDCYISSWGLMDARFGKVAASVQEARVYLTDINTCNSSRCYPGDIFSHNLCSGYLQGGSDSCQVGACNRSTPQQHRQPRARHMLCLASHLPPQRPQRCWGFPPLSHLQLLAQCPSHPRLLCSGSPSSAPGSPELQFPILEHPSSTHPGYLRRDEGEPNLTAPQSPPDKAP